MKCTQCGNISFIEGLTFPIQIDESWKIDKTFKMYVCEECGHVEFFYSGAVERNKELIKIRKKFEILTNEIKDKLDKYKNLQLEMNNKAKLAYNNEVEKLEKILSNDSITVATYKKAKEDLAGLKRFNLQQKLEMCGLSLADYPTRGEIRTLEGQLANAKKEQENEENLVWKKYKL